MFQPILDKHVYLINKSNNATMSCTVLNILTMSSTISARSFFFEITTMLHYSLTYNEFHVFSFSSSKHNNDERDINNDVNR
jgi:hypothetical protein